MSKKIFLKRHKREYKDDIFEGNGNIYGILSDKELLDLDIGEIYHQLEKNGLSEEIKRSLKERRRKLKNRGFRRGCGMGRNLGYHIPIRNRYNPIRKLKRCPSTYWELCEQPIDAFHQLIEDHRDEKGHPLSERRKSKYIRLRLKVNNRLNLQITNDNSIGYKF